MRWIIPLIVSAVLVGGPIAVVHAASPQSDEFNSVSLSSFWTVLDPSAPNSRVSLTDRPGFLRISSTVLNGGGDYCSCSNYNAPRVTQPCSGDWTLEVRMEFSPTFNYQGAGIFAPSPTTGDSVGWRIAERAYYPDGGGQVVRCLGNYVPYSGSVTYFRIVKLADTLAGYWSADGITWNFNGKASTLPVALGMFAVCHDWSGGNTSPAVADFDYFRITDAALPPPVSFCGGFDGNGSPPSRWIQSSNACGAPAEVAGELQLAQTDGCPGGYVAVELDPARFEIDGDFDISVNYRLPNFSVPVSPDDRATGLRLVDNSGGSYAAMERYNRALGDCNPGTQNYKAWFTNSQNCYSGVHWAATSDAVGKFRITRSATVVTDYYWSGSWVALNTLSLPEEAVHLILYGVNPTGSSAFDSRFDSLCVNADILTAVWGQDAGSGRFLRLGASPNPFSKVTTLTLVLPVPGPARLDVFDIVGRRVATLVDERMTAGRHVIAWSSSDQRSGMYLARLKTGGQIATCRLFLKR
jgi:hypothetical protein